MVKILKFLKRQIYPILTPIHKCLLTPINIQLNKRKKVRMLEIGPGQQRLEGFEALNIVAGPNVDYILDASKKLPFKSETFNLIYASHVLEHIPWYQTEAVLQEWSRILTKGGRIEIHVPDGLKIAQAFVDSENDKPEIIHLDGWYRFNAKQDPCIWANGRIFSYGDGTGKKNHPNWHLSIFSERYLRQLLENAGFHNIQRLESKDIRGYDNGWINLGISGTKK